MKPLFNQVAILGLGLIGGSIALEMKKKGLARRVVGYNRSAKGRRSAITRRACDEVFARPEPAVHGSDLVVLATPVRTIPVIARKISSSLSDGAIITDVGSTKEQIVRQLRKIVPPGVAFIGGHPVAGTENSGMESACLDLFKDRWWILTPETQRLRGGKSFRKLKQWTESLGAKSAIMSPREHDRTLALISHLPHMAAYSLVDTALNTQGGKSLKFAAGGFKDFTRIAASSSQMWSEICLDNAEELLAVIRRYEKSLSGIKKKLKRRDGRGLERFFSKCAGVRRKI